MKDRFKFRAFDKRSNTMIYDIQNGTRNDDFREFFTHPKTYIPMQSTGLTDKNGKLIFEGDIVNYYDHGDWEREPDDIEVITWDQEQARFQVGEWALSYDSSYMEVIGNIHENPELLDE